MEFVWVILTGAAAGWLGGQLFKGSGLGLLGDIVIGILGGIIGGWLARKFGISFGDGILGSLLTATGGAILLLFIINLVRKA